MSCPLTLAIGMRSSGRACRQARRTRVSAKAAAWIQHTSCTHPIAGCRERSRIVGRQRYSGRRPYQVSARLYQECQAVSWSRAHWCSKTKAMPDRQRQGFFSRVPKKLSKQDFPQLRIRHNMRAIYCKNRNAATLQTLLEMSGTKFL